MARLDGGDEPAAAGRAIVSAWYRLSRFPACGTELRVRGLGCRRMQQVAAVAAGLRTVGRSGSRMVTRSHLSLLSRIQIEALPRRGQ